MLKTKLKKLLFQADLQDVDKLRIDALRLVSWNYGMARLMNCLGMDCWIHSALKIYQNLPADPETKAIRKQRDFLAKHFAATHKYTELCKWHLESTLKIEDMHKQKIASKDAPPTTSEQPLLEMARHRSAAISRFEAFEAGRWPLDFSSDTSEAEKRRYEEVLA